MRAADSVNGESVNGIPFIVGRVPSGAEGFGVGAWWAWSEFSDEWRPCVVDDFGDLVPIGFESFEAWAVVVDDLLPF